MNKKNTSKATSLRKKAEELLKNKVAKNFSPVEETDAVKLIHELEVHQIELEMINDELVKANDLNEEIASKYIELYDFAPNGYFSINKDCNIIELNFAGAKMLGRDRSKVKTSKFGFFVSPKTRPIYNEFIEKTFSSGLKQTCEVVISNNGDIPIHVCLTGITAENGNYCLVTAIDISENKKAEKLQKASELKFSTFANYTMDWEFWEDENNKLIYMSPSCEKITGYASNEFMSNSELLNSIVHPNDLNALHQHHNKVYNAESQDIIDEHEFRVVKKDSSVIIIHHTCRPIFNEDKKYIGRRVTNRDISEQKRAETIQNIILNISNASQKDSDLGKFIRIIQEELGRVVDTSNFFVALYNEETDTFKLPYYKDAQDNITDFPARKTMTGLVIKKGVSLLLDKEAIIKLVKNGEVEQIGFDSEIWLGIPLKTKDKIIGAFVLQSYTNPTAFTENDKEVLEIISHQISISIERKHHEEELIRAKEKAEESEKYLDSIIDNIGEPVFVKDENSRFLNVNEAFCKIFGLTKSQILGKTLTEDIHPEEMEIFFKMDKLVLKDGNEIINEEFLTVRGGETLTISTRKTRFLGNDGNKYLVGVIRDITNIKKTEVELIKAKEKAEESDRLKSAFLANMSHEIRTPMNGILGFSELLKTPNLSGNQQQKYIGVIEKSGKRMLNIINDIVDISKIEAGLMNVEILESNINEQIEYIYTFFKSEVEAKGMQLFFKNPLPLKEAFIKTDREKLFAILTNLVKNAIKYTNEGSIEFGYVLKTDGESVNQNQNAELEFFVKDTGIGIPKDRQQAVFERFIQADILDKMARQGAGLGLSITKAYVAMLGGKIWVESEEDFGSTFYFTLPYTKELKEEMNTKDIEVNKNTKNDTRNLKILIAEDDEVSEMLISINISEFSAEIVKARTGKETIEACRNNPDIDLILMDIQMPEMNGHEATRQIRKFNKDVIIIAQTAYGLTGDREKSLDAGCNDYITKPINKPELNSLIQKYFSKLQTVN